jgi:hypothetical protein
VQGHVERRSTTVNQLLVTSRGRSQFPTCSKPLTFTTNPPFYPFLPPSSLDFCHLTILEPILIYSKPRNSASMSSPFSRPLEPSDNSFFPLPKRVKETGGPAPAGPETSAKIRTTTTTSLSPFSRPIVASDLSFFAPPNQAENIAVSAFARQKAVGQPKKKTTKVSPSPYGRSIQPADMYFSQLSTQTKEAAIPASAGPKTHTNPRTHSQPTSTTSGILLLRKEPPRFCGFGGFPPMTPASTLTIPECFLSNPNK